MLDRIGSLDEKIRGYMAKQADAQLAARRQAVLADLSSQAKATPEKAAQRVGARYGVSEAGLSDLEGVLRGTPGARSTEVFSAGPQQLLRETAEREAAGNPLYNLQRMLSGTSAMDRAGQAGFYGAAAGGTVAGLTAAGQGLMALMEYMQQGQQSEESREQPLT